MSFLLTNIDTKAPPAKRDGWLWAREWGKQSFILVSKVFLPRGLRFALINSFSPRLIADNLRQFYLPRPRVDWPSPTLKNIPKQKAVANCVWMLVVKIEGIERIY